MLKSLTDVRDTMMNWLLTLPFHSYEYEDSEQKPSPFCQAHVLLQEQMKRASENDNDSQRDNDCVDDDLRDVKWMWTAVTCLKKRPNFETDVWCWAQQWFLT